MSRDLPRSDVRASSCFTRHLNLNPRAPRKLDILDLEAKIMKDCDAWHVDELLVDLRKNMDEPGAERTEAGDNLMRILLIYAMGAAKEEHVVMREQIRSPKTDGCRAIVLCTVSTAMSAMTSRGTAKRAGPVKPAVRWHAMVVAGGRKMVSGLATMVRRHLMRTRLSEDFLRSVPENGLEILKRGMTL
jgi:hypothetical protein